MLSARRRALLALVGVPIAWVLCLASAVIWVSTGEEPAEGPSIIVNTIEWLRDTLPLLHDGEGVWGWRELFWVGPALAWPVARTIHRAEYPTRVGRIAASTFFYSFTVATVAVASAYMIGVGWPLDLFGILVATLAATVTGASMWRQGRPCARHGAVALTLAFPLMIPLTIAGLAYPAPALFLGLLVALAWHAFATLDPKSATPADPPGTQA